MAAAVFHPRPGIFDPNRHALGLVLEADHGGIVAARLVDFPDGLPVHQDAVVDRLDDVFIGDIGGGSLLDVDILAVGIVGHGRVEEHVDHHVFPLRLGQGDRAGHVQLDGGLVVSGGHKLLFLGGEFHRRGAVRHLDGDDHRLDGRAVLDRQQPFPDLHLKGSVLQRRPVGVQQLALHLRRQLGDLQHDVDFAGRPGDVAVLIGHHGPVRVAVRDVLADGAPRHL